MMNLAHPGWLWLLPVLLIPLIAWYIYIPMMVVWRLW